jgi:hypothetical protein
MLIGFWSLAARTFDARRLMDDNGLAIKTLQRQMVNAHHAC